MKALIVHISDIHVRSQADAVVGRILRIASAIRPLEYQADILILAVSGDIVFSGKDEEYSIALDCLARLKATLEEDASWSTVELVLVPGNHDCDFEHPTPVRDLLLEQIVSEKAPLSPELIGLCVEPQRSYFEFHDLLVSHGHTQHSGLYWQWSFSVKDEEIRFYCFNTSWLSQIREVQGSLFYPLPLPETEARAAPAVAVSVFHHPYPWLKASNGLAFRKAIESRSDIVLTGHDHISTHRTNRTDEGEVNEYIEGAVLQDGQNPDESGFNTIMVDTLQRKQRYRTFRWTGSTYEPFGAAPDWESFQANRLRDVRQFAFSDTMAAFLDDPGVDLQHPEHGSVKLQDIFVYPDVREIKYHNPEAQPLVNSEGLIEASLGRQNLLLTGPDQSGKTAVGKMIVRVAHAKGFIPILVKGSDFTALTDERLFESLYGIFSQEYSVGALEAYKQVERTRRVVIIDDFHQLSFTKRSVRTFISLLSRFAGQIILLSSDVAFQLQALIDPLPAQGATAGAFRQYRLQPMGYYRRDMLVQRWFTLGLEDASADSDRLVRRVTETERVMDVVIGKNFVPSFPVYILAMLQAYGNTAVDLSASTHGYFYELFIRKSLSKGLTGVQCDIVMAYLSYLAFGIFTAGGAAGERAIDDRQFQAIHDAYLRESGLRLPVEQMRAGLVKGNVLVSEGGQVRFKYPYLYFYFLAFYLSRNIGQPEIREVIATLSASLEEEASANVLLFLAHLSQDPFIIGRMLARAAEVYRGVQPATLEGDVDGLTPADEEVASLELIDADTSETRRQALAARDEAREQWDGEPEVRGGDPGRAAYTEVQRIVGRLNVAFRTIQILGQILKNFPGSLPAERKNQIASECYQLGLRALGWMLGFMHQGKGEITQELLRLLRVEHPEFSDDELLRRAKSTVFAFAHIVAYGTVKRVAYAVGSPHLEVTYDSLCDDSDLTPETWSSYCWTPRRRSPCGRRALPKPRSWRSWRRRRPEP
ncbi:MAG: metallophosphoesterase, partial [Gemmatimonadales bacterium]